jgi:hypothetical protein
MPQPHRIVTLARGGQGHVALCLSLCLSLYAFVPRPASAATDAVLLWNENAGKAAVAACLSPAGNNVAEGRMYAMVHAAIHDAVNAIDRRYHPYAYSAHAIAATSSSAAIAAAAHDVMVSVIGRLQEPPTCIQNARASVESDYTAALAAIPNGNAKSAGIALGQASAAAILTRREGDGSDTVVADFTYPNGTKPGEYRYPPGAPLAFLPKWGEVTPFALKSGAQFRPGPPYRLSSRRYAADVNEVKSLGRATMSARTPEQTEIGLFWIESSPLGWNRLARTVSVQTHLNLHENARLFALLNMAMADGYIGSWETKYHYNFWRPESAIQLADTDGNPATAADPTWAPLQPTYPIPDHDSGHSVQGGVAAEVLRLFFGTDRMHFTACSRSLPTNTCTDPTPRLRSYRSFSQAAQENATSRIYAGLHFRRAVETGLEHGQKIGRYTVRRLLRPVHGDKDDRDVKDEDD